MLPPSHVVRPCSRKMAAIMAAVVDLPLEPVTPHGLRRTRLEEQLHLRRQPVPLCRRDIEQRIVGPHGRIDHQQFGVAEVGFRVPAQVEGGDGHVPQGV